MNIIIVTDTSIDFIDLAIYDDEMKDSIIKFRKSFKKVECFSTRTPKNYLDEMDQMFGFKHIDYFHIYVNNGFNNCIYQIDGPISTLKEIRIEYPNSLVELVDELYGLKNGCRIDLDED